MRQTLAERPAPTKGPGRELPAGILIVERSRLGDPIPLMDRMPRGWGVLLRDYEAGDRREYAAVLREATRQRGLSFLIAGDWRLARHVGADGLHLPERLVRTGRRFDRVHPDWLITAAAHSRAGLIAAARAGAAAALLSPVFPTRSHPGTRSLGPVRFAGLVQTAPIPVYALGGLDARGKMRVRAAGPIGFAGISGVVGG